MDGIHIGLAAADYALQQCLLCLCTPSNTGHAEHFDSKLQKLCWAGSSIVTVQVSSKLPGKQARGSVAVQDRAEEHGDSSIYLV